MGINLEKELLQKKLLSKVSRDLKKLRKIEKDTSEKINQCHHWEQVRHEGDLIKSHFSSIKKGASSLLVQDWLTDQPITLELDPKKTAKEEMERRFKKAKKLQKGIIPLTKYLHEVQQNILKAEEKELLINQAASLEELAPFLQEAIPKKAKKKDPDAPAYREYTSSTGFKIWVGKNAKANDRLTFQLANGRDWWLHVRGYSGSHVVIRTGKDQEPDAETLKEAMQLALYYSKAKSSGEGEVCLTQRKFVAKMAKPGQVQISRHKTFWVRLDSERIKTILHP